MANEISSMLAFLMKKGEGSTYSKLVDITNVPELGGDPERIEVTTLTDLQRRYIPGIQGTEPLTFEANYNKTDYAALHAIQEVDTAGGDGGNYAVWLGGTVASGVVTPTGSNGKWTFSGKLNVKVSGFGNNEAVKMTITITPNSPVAYSAS